MFTSNKYSKKNGQSSVSDYTYENGTYMYIKFAKEHYIDEKIARKIVADKNYSMALKTLETIYESRDIT